MARPPCNVRSPRSGVRPVGSPGGAWYLRGRTSAPLLALPSGAGQAEVGVRKRCLKTGMEPFAWVFWLPAGS